MTLERRSAGEHLVQHTAEAVDVAPPVDLDVAERLFGAHVLRSTEDGPAAGRRLSNVRRPGDTVIGDQDVILLQQDIFRLHVTMDYSLLMSVGERVGRLAGDPERLGDWQTELAEKTLPQGLPFHERHDIVQKAIRRARVEQRQNVRVLEMGDDPDLTEESLGTQRGGELGAEDFERDLAIVAQVAGEVDGGHAALSQLTLELITISQGCAQSIGFKLVQ